MTASVVLSLGAVGDSPRGFLTSGGTIGHAQTRGSIANRLLRHTPRRHDGDPPAGYGVGELREPQTRRDSPSSLLPRATVTRRQFSEYCCDFCWVMCSAPPPVPSGAVVAQALVLEADHAGLTDKGLQVVDTPSHRLPFSIGPPALLV